MVGQVKKVTQLRVTASNTQLGVLTHSTSHVFKLTHRHRHASLIMAKHGVKEYQSGAMHSVFAQNLPEGANRSFIVEKLAKYVKVNDMYLLALQGQNGIGMLCYDSDLTLPEMNVCQLNDIIFPTTGQGIFANLKDRYALNYTMAGMQPKVGIFVHTEFGPKWSIVKSFDEEFPLLTVNEFVCMEAARYCGLAPPKAYLSTSLETFVVERFDFDKKGNKLGYEDFSTLLNKSNTSDSKYMSSYETLLKAVYRYTEDLAEVEKMYRYIVFNCLIGNGDAHLKNFALLYGADMTNVHVSPPFDITHTLIYDTINNKMALKMANSKVFPGRADLVKLAEAVPFSISDSEVVIEKIADLIADYMKKSNEITLFKGLRKSIEIHLSRSMVNTYSTKNYRQDRKLKFE